MKNALYTFFSMLMAAGVGGSHTSHAQWVHVFTYNTVSLAVQDTSFFAGMNGAVARSGNNGATWTIHSVGLPSSYIYSLTAFGSTLFGGTDGHGVFRSTDGGLSWSPITTGLYSIYAFVSSDSNLYAGGINGISHSSDGGVTWTPHLGPLIVHALVTMPSLGSGIGPALVAGTQTGVFLTTDHGVTWTPKSSGLTNTYIYSLGVLDTIMFAGTTSGIFRSTNKGDGWNLSSTIFPFSFAAINNDIFAGTYSRGLSNQGVFRSTDGGMNWTPHNDGFVGIVDIRRLAIKDTFLFAAVSVTNPGVWRRPLSQLVTTVSNGMFHHPSEFSLQQNYPNPFNPTTKIEFRIANIGLVTLKVFDLLGREVATLVDEVMGPGSYERVFRAEGLASGVYLYQLRAGGFAQTKKLLLLQ